MPEDNARQSTREMSEIDVLLETTQRLVMLISISLGCVIALVILHLAMLPGWSTLAEQGDQRLEATPDSSGVAWKRPALSDLSSGRTGELIRYGRDLIVHTSRYLGPNGVVAPITNGMNCQNCHLEAGTKPFAANYSAVASTYPKFRKRSGTVEGFEKRVNDCLERSLNGDRLPEDSREMKAIVAYLRWLGKNVAPGVEPFGSGLVELTMLRRPADPEKGAKEYAQLCSGCHGEHGQGVKDEQNLEWKYPPLWGSDSYNTGAGLYRISPFAAFVKANMPYGVTAESPLLTDEQAWDIAAFVNSMPRPHKEFPADWPDLSGKPIDHPFGPYADQYGEKEHKYGPFGPMLLTE